MRYYLIFFIAFTFAAHPAFSHQTCRDYLMLSVDEKYDLYSDIWLGLKRGKSIDFVESKIPKFRESLQSAFEVSQDRWSHSMIYDEKAGKPIVAPVILERFGIPVDYDGQMPYGEAGLLHTYGYLLSQIQTPYGKKGKRWIESRIDERLGLAPASFSPFAPQGEFLSNLTGALDLLAARQKPLLDATQTVYFVDKDTSKRHIARIYNRVYALPPLEGQVDLNTRLMVYSIQIDGETIQRYVTAFPVTADFEKNLKNELEELYSAEFRPRYNLYIPLSWKVLRVDLSLKP